MFISGAGTRGDVYLPIYILLYFCWLALVCLFLNRRESSPAMVSRGWERGWLHPSPDPPLPGSPPWAPPRQLGAEGAVSGVSFPAAGRLPASSEDWLPAGSPRRGRDGSLVHAFGGSVDREAAASGAAIERPCSRPAALGGGTAEPAGPRDKGKRYQAPSSRTHAPPGWGQGARHQHPRDALECAGPVGHAEGNHMLCPASPGALPEHG